MSFATTEHELHRACEIIFGPELAVTREFLDYLQPSGVKSAYRKRAMETHPDRFAAGGTSSQSRDNDLFHAVQHSYEHLLQYLKAREQGFRLPYRAPVRPPAWRSARPSATATQQNQTRNNTPPHGSGWNVEQHYHGPLPNRRLLLGHFLYYSGIASWRMVVQALVWQRTQRPRLGELGQRFGLLHEEEIRHILRGKTLFEPFGTSAVAQGYLTEAQLQLLIYQQKRLQRKSGEYFTANNILRPDQLALLLRQYHAHNARLAEELGLRFRF